MPVRCLSSQAMSCILKGRNNWNTPVQRIVRVTFLEIALPIMAVIAAVETLAYGVFSLACFPICLITNKPYKFFAKYLQSSSFTVIWALANLLFNLALPDLALHESVARGFSRLFFRREDEYYRSEQRIEEQAKQAREVAQKERKERDRVDEIVSRGVQLIEKILSTEKLQIRKGLKDPNIERFASLNLFVFSKIVFIYSAGFKKNDKIPDFFAPSTRELIQAIRVASKTWCTPKEIPQVENLMKNFSSFQAREDLKGNAAYLLEFIENVVLNMPPDSLLNTACKRVFDNLSGS